MNILTCLSDLNRKRKIINKNIVPILLSLSKLMVLIAVLFFTEFFYDCSVLLEKEHLLVLLAYILLPLILFQFTNNSIRIIALLMNFCLFFIELKRILNDRNRVFRYIISGNIITTEEFAVFEKNFIFPSAIFIIYTSHKKKFEEMKRRSSVIQNFGLGEISLENKKVLESKISQGISLPYARVSGLVKKGVIFSNKKPTMNEIKMLNIMKIGSKDFRENSDF